MSTSTLTAKVRTLKGPSLVLLRLHRRILWMAGAAVAVGIAGLITLGLLADQAIADFADAGCTLTSSAESCFQPARDYSDRMIRIHRSLMYAGLALMALPAFVGAFLAGPVIAKEWETGTIKLSWTQSTSPSAWLAARLATLVVPVVGGIVVLSAAFSWARSRLDYPFPATWEDPSAFGATGTVPVASALLALALGALTGLLLRRTVPALVVALLGSMVVTFTLGMVRDHLWPMVKTTYPLGGSFPVPKWAYVIEQGYATADGDPFPVDICVESVDFEGCLAGHDGLQNYVHYHPASHYWPLQLVETGILLALAALAAFAAFRVLRRLHG
ncbi:hypothetical protein [Streptomyces sp. NPDC059452]|uniref:hypothetical protein n=1 Tax=Streptomyces sp. NPDC059452 TaxID=3346835 RepID=UPI0036B59968